MRAVVNEKLIARNTKTAQRAVNIGLIILLAAIVVSFNLRYVLVAYGLMLMGIALLNWGTRVASRWHRDQRADVALGRALKSLDPRYQLYSYLLPAEHVLLSPAGLFILVAKTQYGKISCRGERWRHQVTLGRLLRFLIEEQLGNPSRQARLETESLRRFLAKRLPGSEVPIQPVIVFTNPKAELEIVEPTVEAIPLSALKAHLRAAVQEKEVPQQTLKAIADLLNEQAV